MSEIATVEPIAMMSHEGRAVEPEWPVAVFAYNEERRIVECLKSLAKASATHNVRAYVLANGCTDRTEAVVRDFALRHPWVTLVSIALGDKSNAWNVFVHEVAPPAAAYFFVDGDVQIEPEAFDVLFAALADTPEANAAAGVPARGRSKAYQEQLVCKDRLVLGNLYALRGEFVANAKKTGARLPTGMVGDDGLVTSLAKWNLDPTGRFEHERVVPCPDARFTFRSFSLWSVRDWRTYWRRRVRYSIRHFQHELLVPLLKSDGLRGMPNSVVDLYKQQRKMLRDSRPRLGTDTLFDSIAIIRMLKQQS